MTALNVLIEAREKIATPKSWVRGSRRTFLDGTFARCALGAIDAVLGDGKSDHHPATELLAASLTADERELDPGSEYGGYGAPGNPAGLVAKFNNATDHASVLSLFDRTIARQRMIEEMQVVVTEAEAAFAS